MIEYLNGTAWWANSARKATSAGRRLRGQKASVGRKAHRGRHGPKGRMLRSEQPAALKQAVGRIEFPVEWLKFGPIWTVNFQIYFPETIIYILVNVWFWIAIWWNIQYNFFI